MMVPGSIGKIFIIVGIFFIIVGLILYLSGNIFGKLPGDIFLKKGNVSVYIPITTSIILSILLTILLNFIFESHEEI